MTEEEIIREGEKAYKTEKRKGNVFDANTAVAFKLGWDAAVKLFSIAVVSVSFCDCEKPRVQVGRKSRDMHCATCWKPINEH
tara:strand:+ start:164 stop:409 length:246 start_codon:yes stop_codon:yes gene_type:complete